MAKSAPVSEVVKAKKAAPVAPDKVKTTRPRIADMSPEAKAKAIKGLLVRLQTSEDSDEKRTIRSKLRALGHEGGLNGAGTSKKAAKGPAAKGKKAKAPVDEDEDEDVEVEEEEEEEEEETEEE